jgi:hypothetical protein
MNLLRKFLGRGSLSTRTELLNQLVTARGYRDYLEIGVRDPRQNFEKVRAPGLKHSVDPEPRRPVTHRLTSDAFFAQCKDRYDLVFIDGLHIADQVERDIVNSLDHLNDGGTIVLHDCNPLTADAQTDDYDGKKHWNGTVWKAWVKLRATRDDLDMCVIDIDEGCGVIRRGSQTKIAIDTLDYAQMTYAMLAADRTRLLNLVPVERFVV